VTHLSLFSSACPNPCQATPESLPPSPRLDGSTSPHGANLPQASRPGFPCKANTRGEAREKAKGRTKPLAGMLGGTPQVKGNTEAKENESETETETECDSQSPGVPDPPQPLSSSLPPPQLRIPTGSPAPTPAGGAIISPRWGEAAQSPYREGLGGGAEYLPRKLAPYHLLTPQTGWAGLNTKGGYLFTAPTRHIGVPEVCPQPKNRLFSLYFRFNSLAINWNSPGIHVYISVMHQTRLSRVRDPNPGQSTSNLT